MFIVMHAGDHFDDDGVILHDAVEFRGVYRGEDVEDAVDCVVAHRKVGEVADEPSDGHRRVLARRLLNRVL